MKNKSAFIKDLIIVLIIASLAASALTIAVSFFLINVGIGTEFMLYVNALGAGVWGLYVGYQINSLLRKYQ